MQSSIVERRGPGAASVDPPKVPLWCCLVTWTVSPRSREADDPGAKQAIQSELLAHQQRGTWDIESVRVLSEWMSDPTMLRKQLLDGDSCHRGCGAILCFGQKGSITR